MLLQTALANVLFRMGSKYAFHQEGRENGKSEAALAKFVGIKTGSLPSSKTIDDVLNRLNHEDMNKVLMSIFEVLRKSKLFARHQKLTPNGFFHLAIDAETVHKYNPDSAHDCDDCPYCLKRERGETKWYLHMQIVGSIVCPGNIRIPLYVYPIHAKSLRCDGTVSDEKFKQECELSAFLILLKKIRERFPRLAFCVLVDSLYANGSSIETIKTHRMEFMIVRKDGSMKTVGQDCDGLAQMPEHKTASQVLVTVNENNKKVNRSWSFFNQIDYQNLKLNILRFDEWIREKNGDLIAYVHWEWIVSWKLTKRNVAATTSRGRMRWLEEDLFNSLKNRGFKIKHDYSRNPNAQIIWSIFIMIGFLIAELFVFVSHVILLKKNRSLRDFMKSIFYDLCKLGTQVLCASFINRKIQIRYCFEEF